jgi:hypothetical protein
MRVRMSRLPRARPKSIKPGTCYQSSSTYRRCEGCGQRPVVIHLPTHKTGYYCSKCCPACRLKGVARG